MGCTDPDSLELPKYLIIKGVLHFKTNYQDVLHIQYGSSLNWDGMKVQVSFTLMCDSNGIVTFSYFSFSFSSIVPII